MTNDDTKSYVKKLRNFLIYEIVKANEDIKLNDASLAKIDIIREKREMRIFVLSGFQAVKVARHLQTDNGDDDLDMRERLVNLDNSTLGGRRQAMLDVLNEMEAKIDAADLERDTL